MTINELRQLEYSEIQRLYSEYLQEQGLSQNTIQTSRNDAFYLFKNDSSLDFWALLYDPEFESIAKEHLKTTLMVRSRGNIDANLSGYMSHIRRLRRFILADDGNIIHQNEKISTPIKQDRTDKDIPRPSAYEVNLYLELWDSLENYRLQELALNKLFFVLSPDNSNIEDILNKAAHLNDFYSTNIFSIYPVAKHILSLRIDERLRAGDELLVDEIKDIEIGGKQKHFYSFATKYCSHHNPEAYPIYDSYVDDVLCHFRSKDRFDSFSSNDLKNYARFKDVLNRFRQFYGLDEYSLKQLDQYIWQLGKKHFPKTYGKKV